MSALRTFACLCAAAFLPVPASAQMSLLPPACASLKGEALDKCVRDIALPEVVPKLEAVEPPPPDPSLPANCTRVLAADQEYCIWRNEIIIACRNSPSAAAFNACFSKYIPNVKPPQTANCAREKAELRAACATRNTLFAKCLEEPLGYFLCLATRSTPPARAAKP